MSVGLLLLLLLWLMLVLPRLWHRCTMPQLLLLLLPRLPSLATVSEYAEALLAKMVAAGEAPDVQTVFRGERCRICIVILL